MRRVIFAISLIAACAISTGATAQIGCANPVYLTFDAGQMEAAPLIADVLRRHRVKATFFASNLPTHNGTSALSNEWGTWWKAIATQGHDFASLTYDHVLWRGDMRGVKPAFRVRPEAGAFAGREFTWDSAKYCEQIDRAALRLADFTGKKSLPLFRAPDGKISPKLQAEAQACGFAYARATVVLPPRAITDIRSGDILMAYLGTSPRAPSWNPAQLEPLIVGLKERGLCFETLRNRPN